jgi:hypothetical protein
MYFKNLCGVMVFVVAAMGMIPKAIADETSTKSKEQSPALPVVLGSPVDVMIDELYHFGPDSFNAPTLKEQWRVIFGTGENNLIGEGQYPENSVRRDLQLFNPIWLDALEQQTMSDPFIRVPDLVNPYNSSLMTLPSPEASSRVVGSELVYERLPSR